MTERQSRGGAQRNDEVMAAIFDLVEAPDETAAVDSQYRPQALRQLDVPASVDNLLHLTSRRLWLSIAGVALVIAALLGYAATTVRVQAVEASGRAVAPPGVGTVISPSDGIITEVLVDSEQQVTPGQVVATGVTAGGDAMQVTAQVSGQVWQIAVHTGAAVRAGEAVVGLVPDGSGTELMLAVPESQAGPIEVGQRVDLTGQDDGSAAVGTVAAVGAAPIPAEAAASTLAITNVGSEPTLLITVRATDSAVPAGASVRASIVESEQSLLQELLGLG